MSYALVEDVAPDLPPVLPPVPRATHLPDSAAVAAGALVAAALAAAVAVARAGAARPTGDSPPRAESAPAVPRGSLIHGVAEAMDWCLLGLLEALPPHPLFPRIVDMTSREMYAIFGLRSAELFHLVFGGESDFFQQFLAQCGQVDVVPTPWDRQRREVRYKAKSFMPRKPTLEYQRYAFLSPAPRDALPRATATVVAGAGDPAADTTTIDSMFTFSTGLPAADAVGRGPHHLLLHCSTLYGDPPLSDAARGEMVFRIVEHPPERSSASPMVEVFVKYGVNFLKPKVGKLAALEQRHLDEQTVALRKWMELVNDRVTLYLRATGRSLGPVTPSPPFSPDPGGQSRHYMLTDLPSRWRTPRGPCLSMDLGTSDEEADRRGKGGAAGKAKNRFFQSLLRGNLVDDAASLLPKPPSKPTAGAPPPLPDAEEADPGSPLQPLEGRGRDGAMPPRGADPAPPPLLTTPTGTPCGSPKAGPPCILGFSMAVPPANPSPSPGPRGDPSACASPTTAPFTAPSTPPSSVTGGGRPQPAPETSLSEGSNATPVTSPIPSPAPQSHKASAPAAGSPAPLRLSTAAAEPPLEAPASSDLSPVLSPALSPCDASPPAPIPDPAPDGLRAVTALAAAALGRVSLAHVVLAAAALHTAAAWRAAANHRRLYHMSLEALGEAAEGDRALAVCMQDAAAVRQDQLWAGLGAVASVLRPRAGLPDPSVLAWLEEHLAAGGTPAHAAHPAPVAVSDFARRQARWRRFLSLHAAVATCVLSAVAVVLLAPLLLPPSWAPALPAAAGTLRALLA